MAIVSDPSQDAHDRYARTLAYLDRPGGWDFSIEAARAGAARSYIYEHHPAARTPPQIEAAESEARQAERGLWGAALQRAHRVCASEMIRDSVRHDYAVAPGICRLA